MAMFRFFLVYLFLVGVALADPFQPGLVGRWMVEFQDPPEEGIVAAQLESLNLGHLIDRVRIEQSDAIILTLSRNKVLIQAGSHLFESYNCLLEMDEVVILSRQERLSPIPKAYQYELDGDRLILTGSMNKLNDIPVVLRLRRVKAIPVFVTGLRGFLRKNGFLDVGKLESHRGDEVRIKTRDDAPLTMIQLDELTPLDQLSIVEPGQTLPEMIGQTATAEANRLRGLPILLSQEDAGEREPMYFTKKTYFNESIMSEGYLVTIYNTPLGEVSFRAAGTGGGGSRGDLEYRYLVERDTSKLIVWVNEEEVGERGAD